MNHRFSLAAVVLGLALGAYQQSAHGQGYGTDTQNVLAPAAGGMAGVSLAEPQDVPAAIFGNPATLTQFHGTQFTLGGAWAEGYPTVTNSGIPGGAGPFSATSRTPGFASPEIGVIQDLRPVGVPGALGLGFATLSGVGGRVSRPSPHRQLAEQRQQRVRGLWNQRRAGRRTQRPALGRRGDHPRQRAGATRSERPVGQQRDGQRLRAAGTFGLDYALNPCNTVGVFYQSRLDFQFSNAVSVATGNGYRDLTIAQPQTIGLGYANRSLMGGNLLLAADVYYKLWDDVPLYDDIYVNQWAFAVARSLPAATSSTASAIRTTPTPATTRLATVSTASPSARTRSSYSRRRARPRSASIGSPPASAGKGS